MSAFQARSEEFSGEFRLQQPAAHVFDLFSPLGERSWVPGWSPELLHPPGATWERDLIFRTVDERGPVVWIVTALDFEGHSVEYQRLEPGFCVARVAVRCTPLGEDATVVRVSYAWVGLSAQGNAAIADMTRTGYDGRMRQWQRWIEDYFTREPRHET